MSPLLLRVPFRKKRMRIAIRAVFITFLTTLTAIGAFFFYLREERSVQAQILPKITNLVLNPTKFYAGSPIPLFKLQFTLNNSTVSGGLFELHFPKDADKTIGVIEEIEDRDFTITGPSGSEGSLKPHSYTRVIGGPNENVLFFRVDGTEPLPTGQYTIQFPQYGVTTGSQQDGTPDPSVYQLQFLHESERDKPTTATIAILPGKVEVSPNQAANNELVGSQIRLTIALLDRDQESEIVIPKNREWKIIFPPEFTFIGGLQTTSLQPLNPPYPFTAERTEGRAVIFKTKSDATFPWGASYDFLIPPNTVQITTAPETRAVSILWQMAADSRSIGETSFAISATSLPRSGTLTVTPNVVPTGERIPKTLKLVLNQQNGPAIPFNTNFSIAFGSALTIADGLLDKVTFSPSVPFIKTSVSGNTLSFTTKAQETLLANTPYEIAVESGSYTGGQVGTQPIQWKLGSEVIGTQQITVTPGYLYVSPPELVKNKPTDIELTLRLLSPNVIPADLESWVQFIPEGDFEFVQPVTVSIGSCVDWKQNTPCAGVPFTYFLQTAGIVFKHTENFPVSNFYRVTISGVKAVGASSLTQPRVWKWKKRDLSLVAQVDLHIVGKSVRVVPSVTTAKIGENVRLDIDVFNENSQLTGAFPTKRFEFDNTNAQARPKIIDKSIIKTTGITGKYTVTFTFQDNTNDLDDGPGTYTFKAVFDESGADLAGTSVPVTVTAVVAGNQSPLASFITTVGVTPLTINFDGSGSLDPESCPSGDTAGSCLTYSWNFGDGQSSTLQKPAHVYSQAGAYTVSLQVTDKDASPPHIITKTVTVGQPSVTPPRPSPISGSLSPRTTPILAGIACNVFAKNCADGMNCESIGDGRTTGVCVAKPELRAIGTWCSEASHCRGQTSALEFTCDKVANSCVGATKGVSCVNEIVNSDERLGAIASEMDSTARCGTSLFCDPGKGSCENDYGHAAIPADQLGEVSQDVRDNIRNIINILLGFLGVVGVIVTLYGGFTWMTAFGDEDKVGKAKKTLVAGIVGIIIIGIAWTLVSYVIFTAKEFS